MATSKETICALAARPLGVTNGEVATALSTSSENAGGALSAGVKSGWLFKNKRKGDLTHYFTTQQAATNWMVGELSTETVLDKVTHGVIAKAAIKSFKAGEIRSSYELADRSSCTAEFMDQALAPLVAAGKLLRVPTQRSGIDMFTYRYSACWVPAESDFNYAGESTAPKASISPVAPPKSKALFTAPAQSPRAPAAAPRPVASAPQPRKETVQLPMPARPENLGFTFAAAPASASDTDQALLAAMVDSPDAPVIEAGDLAFAINSLGEFVIDLGQGDLVMFQPDKALQLKRFLNHTTILESLEGEAA